MILTIFVLTLLSWTRSLEYSFQITADLGDQTVHCHPGDTIKMKMKSNPTTGYNWTILQHLRQENKIYELISTEFEEDTPRDDKHKKMVGVGGYEMFTIEIDKVGEEYLMIL